MDRHTFLLGFLGSLATAPLREVVAVFPYAIHTVLTDDSLPRT